MAGVTGALAVPPVNVPAETINDRITVTLTPSESRVLLTNLLIP
jgi:hypothetical protein